MGPSRKLEASIPEMDTLTIAQEEQVTELLEKIKTHYEGKYPPQFAQCEKEEDTRVLAYKYLKARKWSSKDAMAMVTDTMKFREERKLDEMGLFPACFAVRGYDEEDIRLRLKLPKRERSQIDDYSNAVHPYYSANCHYWDKEGHPVIYDCSGRCRVVELFNSLVKQAPIGKHPREVAVDYHIYMNEVMSKVTAYRDAVNTDAGKRRIHGVTVVLNAAGLSLGMVSRNILDVVNHIFEIDQKHYPETLHRLVVVNCPSFVTFVYGLVKSSLDPNTQKKVVFFKREDSAAALQDIIDKDKIPKELGGDCECEGGCIPGGMGDGSDEKDGSQVDSDSSDVVSTHEIRVSARKSYQNTFTLNQGEEVSWHFMSIDRERSLGDAIAFSVMFYPMNSPGSQPSPPKSSKREGGVVVFPESRVKENCSQYTAESTGELVLLWDNRSSWLKEKTLQMRVSKPISVKS